MAKYRQVHTTFWDDGFVIDLTPEEKYFYLYLMTNNNTTQCGIYELPYRVMEMHTGYNRDTVSKLLAKFTDYGKILYNESTKEIMMLNWARYNFINSPKVKKCIEKELKAVKHKHFVSIYIEQLKRYGYGIDSLSIDLGEEEEKEKEKEEEKEEKKNAPLSPIDHIFLELKKHFETHVIHQETSYKQAQDIGDMRDDYDKELIIEAMNRSVERGKPNLNYIKGILNNWCTDGITNLAQLQAKEAQVNAKHQRSNASHTPKTPAENNILQIAATYTSDISKYENL